MSKMFSFIKEKFLTKKFITFVIIGVLNTLINFVVMKLIVMLFDSIAGQELSGPESGSLYYVSFAVSTFVAFVTASVFSFFANAMFTYKQKEKDSRTFVEAALAFVLRYIATYLFTLLIWWIMRLIISSVEDPNGWLRTVANLIASICMIPPFYLVLDLVFKRTKNRVEKTEEK